MRKDYAYKDDDFRLLQIEVEPTGSYQENGREVKTGKMSLYLIRDYNMHELLHRQYDDDGIVKPHEEVIYLDHESTDLERLKGIASRFADDGIYNWRDNDEKSDFDEQMDEGKTYYHVFENAPRVEVAFKVAEDGQAPFGFEVSEIEKL